MKDFEKVDKTQISTDRKNRNGNKHNQNYNSEEIKKIDYNEENQQNNVNVIKKEDEKFVEIKGNKCYNEINKILYSDCCLYYYLLITLVSFLALVYSITCFFVDLSNLNFIYQKTDEKPIYLIDLCLVGFLFIELLMRFYIYVRKFYNFYYFYFQRFRKFYETLWNFLDLLIIIFSLLSVSYKLKNDKQYSEKLEDLCIISLIFLRNLIHFIKLNSTVKKQRNIKVMNLYNKFI